MTCPSSRSSRTRRRCSSSQSGQIDGGWEPEPYATEMVLDGGTRLVNEASLWPGGKFVTTNLVVTQSFLKAHPSAVNGLLKGQIEANSYINANGTAAASVANAELTKLLGKGLKPNVLSAALPYIHFTNDPIASSLAADAQHAVAVGLLDAGEEPVRHLRPRPAQRATEGGRAAAGEFVSLDQRQAAPPGVLPGASARSGAVTSDALNGADGTTAVSISEVSKAFGHGKTTLLALDRVSLDVALGEFVCLIGASGCGKSTLLSLVAGLDTPTAGTIDTSGRKVALMFQEPALFPWLTAAKNVELALRPSGMAAKARRSRAAELLEAVHLGGFGDKRPHELSGGMRQRVAMARALATGRRRAADGRAVRRPRRHDPRPAARRAGPDLDGPGPDRAVRHPQRARGGPARRPGGAAVQPARPGHRRVRGAHSGPAPDRLGAGRRAGRQDHRPAARGDGTSWSGSTTRGAGCRGLPVGPRGRRPRRAGQPGDCPRTARHPWQRRAASGPSSGRSCWRSAWSSGSGRSSTSPAGSSTCCPARHGLRQPVGPDAAQACSGRPSTSRCAGR